MRLSGERAVARARALVSAFRPLRVASREDVRVVLTGFGSFPGASRNATSEIVRAIAEANDIALRAKTFRARDLAVGRGPIRMPSGGTAHVSLLVLPVVWDAAAALVAREARAVRATLVVMSGVAAPVQPIFVEATATGARASKHDAFGMRPTRASSPVRARAATLAVSVAREAAAYALAHERETSSSIGQAITGVERRESRGENAYVCNATAHVAAGLARRDMRMLRSSGVPDGIEIAHMGRCAHGFVHWPRDIVDGDASACGRILLAMVDALTSDSRDGEAA